MNDDRIEIRYLNPRAGYVTESFANTTTAGAINSIKARAGNDVQIITLTHLPAPVPPRSSFERTGERGR